MNTVTGENHGDGSSVSYGTEEPSPVLCPFRTENRPLFYLSLGFRTIVARGGMRSLIE
jgi:hypothetical protein